MTEPVIYGASYVLAHAPDLVQYGSKPHRDIKDNAELSESLPLHLRNYEAAASYPPHQAFIGNLHPDRLVRIPRPWTEHRSDLARYGPFGEIMPQEEFYALCRLHDPFNLFVLSMEYWNECSEKLAGHELWGQAEVESRGPGEDLTQVEAKIAGGEAVPLYAGHRLVGCIRKDHENDLSLSAEVLLENIACKTMGILALRHLFSKANIDSQQVEYLIGCGEEAVGDRYQRGGGNLAKAMGEGAGCLRATGCDIKAFCCSPIHSLVTAAALVKAGLFQWVVVVGGASLAKLGMKYRGHVAKELPILEDALAGLAILVGADDGVHPHIRLDAVGRHEIAAESSAQSIYRSLVEVPLNKAGLRYTDIDKYAVELHNPDITEPAGSGNVPLNNYRVLASMAALRGDISRSEMNRFIEQHGMVGFSPTQGHIASAVPYLGYALDEIKQGKINRAMFIGKGSLFLGRMTHMSDGMSFLLEAQ